MTPIPTTIISARQLRRSGGSEPTLRRYNDAPTGVLFLTVEHRQCLSRNDRG
eukprot:CAMPEP_0185752174 /NCGR_PEP_ID=MMETSP1174-20130828/10987_1 /TAXON_ID=35687 /ORGANISM="Dictyocha speculum, Strain CCMP1381" /LENGTH=51 /DNA_ID=CAMNT_0028429513 /DNA_START=27 /DNA_END=182 /DNA_ORIENTATION=+